MVNGSKLRVSGFRIRGLGFGGQGSESWIHPRYAGNTCMYGVGT